MAESVLADLHMHSCFSDGSDSPEELLRNVRRAGIGTFALTDHDTFEGAVALENRIPADMRYIRGIEFSTKSRAGKCHVLGYDFDPDNPDLKSAVAEGRELREEKLKKRLLHLKDLHGITLTAEEMAYLRVQNSVGKPHLARVLVKRGLSPDISSAIRDFIDDHGGKESGDARISSELAVRSILSAGGIPVLAHPLGGEGERHLAPEEAENLIGELVRLGILGLECYYSRYSAAEEAFLLSEAEKYHLRISGGSDYHGTAKNIRLGTLRADGATVPLQKLTILRQF